MFHRRLHRASAPTTLTWNRIPINTRFATDTPPARRCYCAEIALDIPASGAYQAFGQWLEANGYHISGPSREVYLQYAPEMGPADYVTEIQFPVEKD
ncbi:MAG: GyrI-like domain-containing protein [Anaerolineae bacterium]|nr:GyrI-like domain-containing protein [Anaerolineae bacterium]